MKMNDYQDQATTTAAYSGTEDERRFYVALGLCGEAGEAAEKVKKWFRDGPNETDTRIAVAKELGDVLWYLSQFAKEWGWTLEEVAEMNIAKLAARRAAGTIKGSGDNR